MQSDATEKEKIQSQNKWEDAQRAFFRKKKNNCYKDNRDLMELLSVIVRIIATNPNNAEKSMGWFLKKADKATRQVYEKLK